MKQILTINKPNIMKKSKYQQYSHCFIVCILVPYAFWFSYQANIVTILISDTFRGATLIRGRRLFQCGYSKVRRLLVWRLLEEMRYLNSPVKKQSLEVFCKSRCSWKFHKVRISFLIKLQASGNPPVSAVLIYSCLLRRPSTLLKMTPWQVFFF